MHRRNSIRHAVGSTPVSEDVRRERAIMRLKELDEKELEKRFLAMNIADAEKLVHLIPEWGLKLRKDIYFEGNRKVFPKKRKKKSTKAEKVYGPPIQLKNWPKK